MNHSGIFTLFRYPIIGLVECLSNFLYITGEFESVFITLKIPNFQCLCKHCQNCIFYPIRIPFSHPLSSFIRKTRPGKDENMAYSDSIKRYTKYFLMSCLTGILLFTSCSPEGPEHIEYRVPIVSFSAINGYFPLSVNGQPVPLYIDDMDYPGVIRAMGDLQADIKRVTHTEPLLSIESIPVSDKIVIAGTIGKSPVIDRLADEGRIDISDVKYRWETFLIQVVNNPEEGIDEALVIAGSDKRGTVYGIYELSRQIGVSPWFWWADVPVPHQPNLYVSPQPFTLGEPAVQYRGIFINNENPSLLEWVNHTFGGFNHTFYEKIFELILRLRGNYLWPAMWGKAFHDDDPLNPELADTYGVVIGYTHHEPMMRAHVEWARYGRGPWDYDANTEVLREFWREGIERMETYESSVTLGMRGDGDEPMTDEANIDLLERIVNDQRHILNEHAQQELDGVLQIWALYKEVQEYYEKGMEVPEDVMILLANDNWGNVRLLPDPKTAHERIGGWGMYYHFDYVGGPRNYKWINTIQISRIWEQLHLTYQYGVNRMWLVNVGDIKPMEFPISFFLDFAWNPDAIPVERMAEYPRWWATQQFGREYAGEIAHLLTEYTRYNSRRKPELLSPETYSLIHYREAERIVEDYNNLAREARRVYDLLPEEYRDAYYQLVLYPIEASANINELYVTVAQNRLYSEQGRAATNAIAEKARRHFDRNSELDYYYHNTMSGGKWVHMMSQTRIGYTYWQQPDENAMPEVSTIRPPAAGSMGVAIEGSGNWWPHATKDAVLPEIDTYHRQSHYIEIFNRGMESFDYSISTDVPWLETSSTEGNIGQQERIWVQVDWDRVPEGKHRTPITINGSEGTTVTVFADIFNPSSPSRDSVTGFVEGNGFVSIEAPHVSRMVNAKPITWVHIPQLGRTHSAMTPFPVLAESRTPGSRNSPRLEYDMHLFNSGEVTVKVYLSPTKNYTKREGLRYGISFNDETPQIINMHEEMLDGFRLVVWERWVANNINVRESSHMIESPGAHTLKFWMVDPGVVLQKIVVETGDVGQTYLGPPESSRGIK
jgi:hypothetical protein